VYQPSANIHRFNFWPVVALSFGGAVLLLAFANQYGIFRDELYYYACSQNLAFGYVDQPPLSCWLMWLVTHTLGKSLFAIRFLPAVAFGASVYLTAKIAQQLEGGGFAMLSAALLMLCMPLALGLSHLYTMNAFDYPLWALIVCLLLKLENTGDARLWLSIGAVVGVTILNKYAILFFVAALLLAMALTLWRRWFAIREFWFGAMIAAVIALPNLIWQWSHHFPFLELMANIKRSGRDISPPPVQFAIQQFQIANPMSFILAIIGAVWLLSRRRYRALGIVFFAFYLLLEYLGAKNYYLGPIYPLVFAAGAVVLERAPRWLAVCAMVVVVTIPAIMLPLLIPVLSPERFIAYEKALHYEVPKFEKTKTSPLPQIYADMFGWEDIARQTAAFYHSLPPEQQRNTVIWGDNYGAASAIYYYRDKYNLPAPIGPHQSYWIWGPRGYHSPDIINIGSHDDMDLKSVCDSVQVIGQANDPLSRGDEHYDIYYCRGLHIDLQREWPKEKRFS
jgi:hypothetical protein